MSIANMPRSHRQTTISLNMWQIVPILSLGLTPRETHTTYFPPVAEINTIASQRNKPHKRAQAL